MSVTVARRRIAAGVAVLTLSVSAVPLVASPAPASAGPASPAPTSPAPASPAAVGGFTDTFAGSPDAHPYYGLNVALDPPRQTGAAGSVPYTRVSGLWNSEQPPLPGQDRRAQPVGAEHQPDPAG